MSKKPSLRKRSSRPGKRAVCEDVNFAEVEFTRPVMPRLVVQFSDGLSILIEDQSAVGLAAQFIAEFRASEKGGRL